jgi:uncharacterized protein
MAGSVIEFCDPPPVAAFRHREARDGFEVVFFDTAGEWIRVNGSTSAVEAGEAWAIEYAIELDRSWRTRRAIVRGRSRGGVRETVIATDGGGTWTVHGKHLAAVDGCLDLDLESSSLTNAFPVRRLGLEVGQTAEAPAAYVRAPDLGVEHLEQRYERIADRDDRACFDYWSPRFDFRCELEYDRSGLVVAYPGLAVRAA